MRVSALLPALAIALAVAPAPLASQSLAREIDARLPAVMPKVVAWRRDFHEHPELSNRETRTSGIVADHLQKLGIEVRRVAGTGVVGVLRGGKPGKVIALRADMDALPVTEEVDLPFRSTVKSTYNGQAVGVMHACGHDMHTAMLMGVAEVLAGMKEKLPGTVLFLFQPAEEGVPAGETGGAPRMVAEGAIDNPKPDAVLGLHVVSWERLNDVVLRPGGLWASSDTWEATIRGRQTHGAQPWGGVDPIVVASQVVQGIQTIVSRQVDLAASPAVVTIGTISGGTRFNIIPDSVTMSGTIRTFDPAMRDDIKARLKRTIENIPAASGATGEFRLRDAGNPVTWNDPALAERLRGTVERVAGREKVKGGPPTTVSEDFPYFTQKAPGLYLELGVTPDSVDMKTVARNHSPRFYADERAMPTGVRLMASLAADFLSGGK